MVQIKTFFERKGRQDDAKPAEEAIRRIFCDFCETSAHSAFKAAQAASFANAALKVALGRITCASRFGSGW